MILRVTALGVLSALALCASPSTAASTITVSDVWSRPATGTGVVYATIRNASDKADMLLSASSPVAKSVELHKTVPVPPDSMGGMKSSMGGMNSSMGGMMMQPVSSIPIPAHGSARLRPGGYHVMLIGLRHDLHEGEMVPLTLRFRHAGAVSVTSHVEMRTR